jgi:ERCC4-related helicase
MSTPYHSLYWANALTLKGEAGTIDDLSRSIANARVDLNPHQVEAALFAVRSPLSRGVLLADEVGLGKTIEAGIVLAQRWAERRRRLLLILPANLRKQWQQELDEKFALPSIILESKSFNQLKKDGVQNPFDQPGQVVICSYNFAAAKATELGWVTWDLAVLDEAHRLRNVYKSGNKIASAIRDALHNTHKLLLTATPLQNSLLELYGLVSVIDEHLFGDLASFRLQFLQGNDERGRNAVLHERLKNVCIRTLRKQVLEYIRFTQRTPITEPFFPSDAEQQLYEEVSAYLQRDELFALPVSQRKLLTLILRKLLASSSFAIAGTLRIMAKRLEDAEQALIPALEEDYEGTAELAEEWDEESPEAIRTTDARRLHAELKELKRFVELAESIRKNTKGEKLLTVLNTALDRAIELGARRKAVIFTESRRTQQYLYELLTEHGYAGELVLINGSNADADSRAIYGRWKDRHADTQTISGSRTADMKAALVEEFRDHATILIATESAAEGVNLQFCSLVVNFDLPWNPQRVEQRIGRCHRYGQKHDVVVVNFINMRNAADKRVFELLSKKFCLFDGVFGASDEVLGAIESGVDFERRIAEVYQTCRTEAEIQAAFDELQRELDCRRAPSAPPSCSPPLANGHDAVAVAQVH